jgi:hypothetical protein
LQKPDPQLGLGMASAFIFGVYNELRNNTAANKAKVFFTVRNPFKMGLHRDNVLSGALLPDHRGNVRFPKNVSAMMLNSALEDLRSTTLKAISGSLRRLEYFAGLRNAEGSYDHWGLARVHGDLAATKALDQEHRSLVSGILSTPLHRLVAELEHSSQLAGTTPALYLERLIHEADLLPREPGAGAARHFNSVLHVLSCLAKVPPDAIRLTS